MYEVVPEALIAFSKQALDQNGQELHELEAETARLHHTLAHKRHFIAPVRRLPSEVLGEIFLFYTRDQLPPWDLVAVCRAWRVTAACTPRLWSSLWLYNPISVYWGASRDTDYQLCKSTKTVERILLWAKAAPLNIWIEYYWTDSADELREMEEMLKVVTRDGRVAQWRSLIVAEWQGYEEAGGVGAEYLRGNYKQLEQLRVASQVDSILESLHQYSPPNLHAVHLGNSVRLQDCARASWWRSVEEIDTGSLEINPNVMQVFQRAPALKEVFVQNWNGPFDSNLFKSPVITTLRIGGAAHTFEGTFTDLSHLTLGDLLFPGLSPDVTPLMNLPKLHTLTFQGTAFMLLAKIHAPVLHTLSINSYSVDDFGQSDPAVETKFKKVFLSSHKPRLESDRTIRPSHTLVLNSIRLSGATLISILRVAGETIEKLSITRVFGSQHKKMYNALGLGDTASKRSKAHAGELCSRLRTLHIDLSYSRYLPERFNEEAVYGWMQETGRARRERDRPLEEFTCQFRRMFDGEKVHVEAEGCEGK